MTNLFTKHLTLHNFKRMYNRINYIGRIKQKYNATFTRHRILRTMHENVLLQPCLILYYYTCNYRSML